LGTFKQTIEVGDFNGRRFVVLDALVDTGATYTFVPREVLAGLDIEPDEQRSFILANGGRASYGLAWVRLRLNGREQPTLAVFGDEGSQALLGAFTLEGFGLAVDTVNLKLESVPGYLVGLLERLR
jgi:predicted aspartyl protease